MKHQMSEEQCKILNAKGNIVVTANAGAGKTFILVEKINKSIEENKNHENIMIVTLGAVLIIAGTYVLMKKKKLSY